MQRRIAMKLLLFVFAGAIINVAVAWGLAWWSPQGSTGPGVIFLRERFGVIDHYELPPYSDSERPQRFYFGSTAGWPIQCINVDLTVRHGSIPLDQAVLKSPIWPGFAINTIFYAAIVWVLFAVPGAVRRLRGGVRIKRGQCAACGYSLRENFSDRCPECGAAVIAPSLGAR